MRIVHEIALSMEPGILRDDLDAVLIDSDRPVRTEAIEHCANGVSRFDGKGRVVYETLCETSSSIPTVKPFLVSALASASNADLAIAGVKSFEERP